MIEARASRTAIGVAVRRASHQLYDAEPRVFDDPMAVRLLEPRYGEFLRREKAGMDEAGSRALRAHLVARSRFAEECVAEAFGRGVRQYCSLGAGLDTFGLRNRYPGLKVFEVDYPATQAWKRELIGEAGLCVPETMTFVPVDFERQTLEEQMAAAGFDRGRPAFFSWLGVVLYLTREAFRSTVECMAGCPPGSALAMDYMVPRAMLPAEEQAARDAFCDRVASVGEPVRLTISPEQMAGELRAFERIEDLSGEEINRRYFGERGDGLAWAGRSGRLLHARR